MSGQVVERFYKGVRLVHVEAALYALAPYGLWCSVEADICHPDALPEAHLWSLSREHDGLEVNQPTRHTWQVWGAGVTNRDRQGIIDLFDLPAGTRVAVIDGGNAWGGPGEPIGQDLHTLADALDDLLARAPEEHRESATAPRPAPAPRIQERAKLFAEIIVESPHLGQRQVAQAAAERHWQTHGGERPKWNEDTVSNTFRTMREAGEPGVWDWRALKEAARNP